MRQLWSALANCSLDSMATTHARLFGALFKSLPPNDMAGIMKYDFGDVATGVY